MKHVEKKALETGKVNQANNKSKSAQIQKKDDAKTESNHLDAKTEKLQKRGLGGALIVEADDFSEVGLHLFETLIVCGERTLFTLFSSSILNTSSEYYKL